jgi:hypothetical protein
MQLLQIHSSSQGLLMQHEPRIQRSKPPQVSRLSPYPQPQDQQQLLLLLWSRKQSRKQQQTAPAVVRTTMAMLRSCHKVPIVLLLLLGWDRCLLPSCRAQHHTANSSRLQQNRPQDQQQQAS